MKTYNAWLLEGRVPAAGERAEHYFVNADRSKGVAAFRLDQTVPIHVESIADCEELITREEWDAVKPKKGAARPTAKVRLNDRGMFQIWVGNNKPVIEHLRKNYWSFDSRTHRWCARLDVDISNVVIALEKLGCTVTVEDTNA